MQCQGAGRRRRAELVAQEHAQLLVGAQRLGRVAPARLGLHHQDVAVLAERLALDEGRRGALGRREMVPAQRDRRSRGDLERAQLLLVGRVAGRVHPVAAEGRQQRAGQDLERLLRRVEGGSGVTVGEPALRALDSGSDDMDVDASARRQHEAERLPSRDELGPERAPHLREDAPERGMTIGGRAGGPDDLDQLVSGDRARRLQDQVGDQCPPLPAREAGCHVSSRELDPELPEARDRRVSSSRGHHIRHLIRDAQVAVPVRCIPCV